MVIHNLHIPPKSVITHVTVIELNTVKDNATDNHTDGLIIRHPIRTNRFRHFAQETYFGKTRQMEKITVHGKRCFHHGHQGNRCN